jgi:hypothetical protein
LLKAALLKSRSSATAAAWESDSYQGTPSGVPQEPDINAALAAANSGQEPATEAPGLFARLAASLKRSPDTNPIFQTALLPLTGESAQIESGVSLANLIRIHPSASMREKRFR